MRLVYPRKYFGIHLSFPCAYELDARSAMILTRLMPPSRPEPHTQSSDPAYRSSARPG